MCVVKNTTKSANSSGSSINLVTKLGAALRWLAGGSYLDICGMFGLDPHHFFDGQYVLWETIQAIDNALDIEFSLDAGKKFSTITYLQ